MVRPIPQALYSYSSAETLTCHLIFILPIHPLHCCHLHQCLHHPPLSCFEFLHAPITSMKSWRPEDEHISLPGPSPAGNSAVLAHGYQKMVSAGVGSRSPDGQPRQGPALVQAKCKVLPFVAVCAAVFVALAASNWDSWEVFMALSEGIQHLSNEAHPVAVLGQMSCQAKSKCAKQPVLLLEQKYPWATGKQCSADIALIAVRE